MRTIKSSDLSREVIAILDILSMGDLEVEDFYYHSSRLDSMYPTWQGVTSEGDLIIGDYDEEEGY